MRFDGQVALITGAANGIGRAAALSFAKGGAKIVAVDKDGPGAEKVAAEIKAAGGAAIARSADVSKSADVAAYVEAATDAYSRIDCFFNNAGIEGKVSPIIDYDEATFDQVLAVNIRGVFLGLKYVMPVMLRQKSGAIVNTSLASSARPGCPRMWPPSTPSSASPKSPLVRSPATASASMPSALVPSIRA
jgi:NAD(P)-dependent dehydrogenase (short-subunit alcohol dehydrogenase family)